MPIPVACQCGQRFAANDNLAGKQLKCPNCGGPLNIPPMQSPSMPMAHDMQFPRQPAQQPGFGYSPPTQQQYPGSQYPGQQYPGSQMGMPPMNAPGQSNWETDWETQAGGSFGSPYPQYAAPAPKKQSSKGLVVGLAAGLGTAFVGIIVIVVILLARSGGDDDNAVARPESPRDVAIQDPVPDTPAPANIDPTTPSPVLPTTDPDPVNTNLPPVVGPQVPVTPTDPGVPQPLNPTIDPNTSNATGPQLATSSYKWYSNPAGTLRGARPVDKDSLVIVHYSWMCNLLPYVGHQELYDKFDFKLPWTRDPNLSHTREVVEAFLNPSDKRKTWTGLGYHGLALTHFVGVAGVEDNRNDVAAKLPRNDPRAGVFGYDQVARMSEITDGTSQTIMIIGSGEFANPWVQGGGATIRGARQPYFDDITGFGSKGMVKKGAYAVMADGSTRFIPADIDPTVFRAMCTIHGSDSVDISAIGPELDGFR